MAEGKKSEGILKPIIIGVASTVLASVVVYHLGFDQKAGPAADRPQTTTLDSQEELRQRQAALEAKIHQLSEKELEHKQAELEEKLRQAELAMKEARQQEEQGQNLIYSDYQNYSDIGGTWQDPNTGASYLISQDGDYFTIQEFSWGIITAAGEGRITGNRGDFSYMTVYNTAGTGYLTLSPDGSHITCVFTDMTTQTPMTIHLLPRK